MIVHFHVRIAVCQFIQQLGQKLLPRRFLFGACDPADIIILLIRGPRRISIQ